MARKPKSGKILAFHKPSKRWCKNYTDYDGKRKTKYFGHGTSDKDIRSYEEALSKYLVWKQGRDSVQKASELMIVEKAVLAGKLPVAELGSSPWAIGEVTRLRLAGMVTVDGYVNQDVVDPDKRNPERASDGEHWEAEKPEDWEDEEDLSWAADDPVEFRRQKIEQERQVRERLARLTRLKNLAERPKANGKGSLSISQHIDSWLAAEQLNVDAGELGASSHRDKRNGINTFRLWLGCTKLRDIYEGDKKVGEEWTGGKSFGKPAEIDKLLMDYRAYLLKRVAIKKDKSDDKQGYTPATFNDKVKFGGQFIKWCWKNNAIKDQARVYDDFAKKLYVEKGGEPLTVEQVQDIWAAAGPRMRCFIALGLNCAFKPGDISSLTGKQLQGDRLLGIREKTKKLRVPMNYKLWPITQKLIKQERDNHGDDELIFTNTKGTRIDTGTMGQLFKKVAVKADVAATFQQFRDTSIDIVKQALHQGDGDIALLQVFQAHKDSSTAQYYVSDDPRHLKSPVLDKIVMGLQDKHYQLKP